VETRHANRVQSDFGRNTRRLSTKVVLFRCFSPARESLFTDVIFQNCFPAASTQSPPTGTVENFRFSNGHRLMKPKRLNEISYPTVV